MKIHTLALMFTLIALPCLAQAQLAKLTVIVTGMEPATGTLEVSVFNTEESFMNVPLVQQSLGVDGETELQFEFAGMLDGDYAVVVVHDENDNGLLDTGFLGFGSESFAYSNNASSLFGRPSFEAAGFTIGEEDQTITISVD